MEKTITDYAVTLNQRSYLTDALKTRFKKLGLQDKYDINNYNFSILWHITGRISLLKYKYLLSLYFNNQNDLLITEVDNLISAAKDYDGKRAE